MGRYRLALYLIKWPSGWRVMFDYHVFLSIAEIIIMAFVDFKKHFFAYDGILSERMVLTEELLFWKYHFVPGRNLLPALS